MKTLTMPSAIISLPEIIRARKPSTLLKRKLLRMLEREAKKLNILWSPEAFGSGLSNPKLPVWLLEKLETLVSLAQAVDWKVSRTLRDELDSTIEDIETFNPVFRKSLKRISDDVEAGRFVSQDKLESRFGLTR